MYAIINVDEGIIEALRETRQEAEEDIKIYKFSDNIEGKRVKYIIRKEENI